ncbi:hypothetical protein Stube_12040 [Streptomyces tubercidicus]|uniref:Uncharacterized protein n=2 Tax=Streptomyces tubercidicus TaxID=47759 RepID=A0A640UPA8_9ACTN|nr:hypothetical protein Stube_12040 [Streptomyces tubercidicus]
MRAVGTWWPATSTTPGTYSPGSMPPPSCCTAIRTGGLTPAANAPLLTARIPRSRMHLFTGARHASFQERRDRAGQLVSTFLADPTGPPLPETGHS